VIWHCTKRIAGGISPWNMYMEKGPSEADSHSASQGIYRLSHNSKICYRIYRSLPLVKCQFLSASCILYASSIATSLFWINYMELSPSWGAASCAATQEFHKILWNPKVYYRVHKSPPPVPILSLISPAHTTPAYLRSILILTLHLRLGLPSGLIPSDFPTKILYAFPFSSCVLHALSTSFSLTWSI
jgi:hypothetical protein